MAHVILNAVIGYILVHGARTLSPIHVGNFLSRSNNDARRETQYYPIRVACVGGSITEGSSSPGEPYPSVLQKLLGRDYLVENLADIGLKVQKGHKKDWPKSYWLTPEYKRLTQSRWDVVVFTMGTCDATDAVDDPEWSANWNHEFCDAENVSSRCKFWSDYSDLIQVVQNVSSPDIFITVPPPVLLTSELIYGINATIVNSILPKMLPKIATANGISADHVIDFFRFLGGGSLRDVPGGGCTPESNVDVCKLFCDESHCDQVHLIGSGKKLMAQLVADAIKNKVLRPSLLH